MYSRQTLHSQLAQLQPNMINHVSIFQGAGYDNVQAPCSGKSLGAETSLQSKGHNRGRTTLRLDFSSISSRQTHVVLALGQDVYSTVRYNNCMSTEYTLRHSLNYHPHRHFQHSSYLLLHQYITQCSLLSTPHTVQPSPARIIDFE